MNMAERPIRIIDKGLLIIPIADTAVPHWLQRFRRTDRLQKVRSRFKRAFRKPDRNTVREAGIPASPVISVMRGFFHFVRSFDFSFSGLRGRSPRSESAEMCYSDCSVQSRMPARFRIVMPVPVSVNAPMITRRPVTSLLPVCGSLPVGAVVTVVSVTVVFSAARVVVQPVSFAVSA